MLKLDLSVFSFFKLNSFIYESNIQDQFRERCRKIMKDSCGIAWGFGDESIE